MEALLQADRFFGVSLLLLQQTLASFLAAFILSGSAAITFEFFTHEWLRNPVRVAAAQEARRIAGRASVAARAARAATLGVRSRVTGLPDGMGMNIAGGAQKLLTTWASALTRKFGRPRSRRGFRRACKRPSQRWPFCDPGHALPCHRPVRRYGNVHCRRRTKSEARHSRPGHQR